MFLPLLPLKSQIFLMDRLKLTRFLGGGDQKLSQKGKKYDKH